MTVAPTRNRGHAVASDARVLTHLRALTRIAHLRHELQPMLHQAAGYLHKHFGCGLVEIKDKEQDKEQRTKSRTAKDKEQDSQVYQRPQTLPVLTGDTLVTE
jgi:hypothetical protein